VQFLFTYKLSGEEYVVNRFCLCAWLW